VNNRKCWTLLIHFFFLIYRYEHPWSGTLKASKVVINPCSQQNEQANQSESNSDLKDSHECKFTTALFFLKAFGMPVF
jgi:hypothetical protein